MSPLAADGIVRQTLGGEAERLGKQLDVDTLKYLEEAKSCRALQIPAGQDQLTAMEYVAYLGIKLDLEPELAWLAREMLAAPMPPNAELKVSKAGVVYFHDTVNDYYTIEHPLTQRYLKVLERQRVDLLCLGTKPSVNGLLFKQPDMLFQRQFRNLQIPCQSCGVMQSTVKCNQCLMSFCGSCADALHKTSLGPRSNHTFLQTACGSLCSSCTMKKPQVYCANCEDYFCFKCFEDMHGKGNRQQHKSMLVNVSDGDIIEPQKRCEECEDNPAAFACDYCLDNFCVKCFWQCHVNGHRRTHTATKVNVVPQCNQCQNIRATVFCEQCQELMCTECFTKMHTVPEHSDAWWQAAARSRSLLVQLVEELQPVHAWPEILVWVVIFVAAFVFFTLLAFCWTGQTCFRRRFIDRISQSTSTEDGPREDEPLLGAHQQYQRRHQLVSWEVDPHSLERDLQQVTPASAPEADAGGESELSLPPGAGPLRRSSSSSMRTRRRQPSASENDPSGSPDRTPSSNNSPVSGQQASRQD